MEGRKGKAEALEGIEGTKAGGYKEDGTEEGDDETGRARDEGGFSVRQGG